MADLKTLRNRIKGVKGIKKITQAMKVVAASKLKKARNSAEEARLFTNATRSAFLNSLSSIDGSDEVGLSFLNVRKAHKVLLVVVSTDRGLCGGLNTNIVKHTMKQVAKIRAEGQDCKVFAIGKKAAEAIKHKDPDVLLKVSEGFSSRKIDLDSVNEIKKFILHAVDELDFKSVRIVYPGFVSAISQVVIDKLFIGSKTELLDSLVEEGADEKYSHTEFEYDPSQEEVVQGLFDYYVLSTLNQALFESYASEQGARMTAMDNAVNNCSDLVGKLTLVYNRTRQAKITTELVEIISAVESI